MNRRDLLSLLSLVRGLGYSGRSLGGGLQKAWSTTSRNIISSFGARNYKGMKWHSGIDIEGEVGAPLFAGVSGTIVGSYYDPVLGYVIKVRDRAGRYTTEHHGAAAQGRLSVGKKVRATDLVGYSGNTESPDVSSGAHVHFGVYDAQLGKYIDPLLWYQGGA